MKLLKSIFRKNKYLHKLAVKIYLKIENVKSRYHLLRKVFALINNKECNRYQTLTVKSYLNGKKVKTFEDKQLRDIYIPPIITKTGISNAQVNKYSTPEIYGTELNNVTIVGDNNFLIIDNFCLDDKYGLAYADEINFNTGSRYRYTGKDCFIEVPKKKVFIEKGIFLVGEATNNYYHWMFDVLSRVIFINQIDNLDDWPLIIDESVTWRKSYMELLELVDCKKHPIISLGRHDAAFVRKMYYVSPCTWASVYNLNNNTVRCMKDRFVIQSLKSKILNEIKNKKFCKIGEKLFIVRTHDNEKTRRLINEKEIAEIAKKYGFELYDPGQHSILEQAHAFNKAKYIIGDEGAALGNSMYCGESTTVFCIIPETWRNYVFSTIAYAADNKMIYLDAEDLGNRKHRLNTEMFEAILKQL